MTALQDFTSRLSSRLRSRRLGLSIQGNTLRLLLVQRNRVVTWAQIPFNPAFLRGGFISDIQGMSHVIRNAMISKGMPRAPLIAAFPGLQSVVRTFQLPRARDLKPSNVIPREARRLMAFSPGEQHLFWEPVDVRGVNQRYLALAVPRRPLHSFVETLTLAEAFPTRIELTPLALARLVPQSQAIIADVERDSIDIAIVADSVPALVRSLWLGDEPLSLDTAPTRLAEELAGTISYYNDAYAETRVTTDLPIHVAGGFPVEDLAPAVSEGTGHPVMPLVAPLIASEAFPAAVMAVPAGLVARG